MRRRKNIINHTGIPDYKIEAIARCILPDIIRLYNSNEGQREYVEWKQKKEYSDKIKTNENIA